MAEDEAIREHCYAILGGSDTTQELSEEDRIDEVQAYVRAQKPDLDEDAVDRLVLDVLWEHRTGERKPAKLRVVGTRASKPIRLPDAEQVRQHVMSRRQAASAESRGSSGSGPAGSVSNHPQRKQKKWVNIDEVASAEASRTAPETESPYNLLRSILGQDATDQDIERVLAHNEFDISRTVDMLMGAASGAPGPDDDVRERLLTRDQTAERVMCKYFLQSGLCMRGSDCMYSHDIAQRICRFWLQNRCLAGENCVFLHEVPEEVMAKLALREPPPPSTAKQVTAPNLEALPTLGTKPAAPTVTNTSPQLPHKPPVRFDFGAMLQKDRTGFVPPTSTGSPQTSSQGSGTVSGSRTANSPATVPVIPVAAVVNRGRVPVVAPRLVPWKNPEFGENQQYVDLRIAARKSGELRNKYLQLATNAWSHNDPAAAKALSKKGQDFHKRMVDDSLEAGTLLFEQRTRPSSEVYIDLHGYELGAAIDRLEACLRLLEENEGHNPRVAYVICGRGHFKVKKYADQLSQHVNVFLDDHGYIHRDFGETPQFGRIIGVDPWSVIR